MAFKINNTDFPCPKGFIMPREDNIVGSFKTLSGKTIGDIRGWKYSNNKMVWAYLTTEEINILLAATSNQFTITFDDIDGQEKTVAAIRTTTIANKIFRIIGGKPTFTDIEMGVSFPDVYYN